MTQESTSRRAKRPLDVLTEWATSLQFSCKTRNADSRSFRCGEFFPSRQRARPRTRGGPFQLAQASRARFGKKRWYVRHRRPSPRRVRRRRRRRSAVSRRRRRCAARVWLGIARVARRARCRISGAGTSSRPARCRGTGTRTSSTIAGVRPARSRVLSGGRGAPTRPAARDRQPYFRGVSVRGSAFFLRSFAPPPSRPTGP